MSVTRCALLVGFGSIGAKRARILRDFGWHVTIVEPDAERRMAATAHGFQDVQLGAGTTSADVAFVCSPPKHHAENVIACLQNSCHVFIEKPIAHTLEDARQICEAAAASDRHIMVGCNYRFVDSVRIVQEDVRSLEITFRYHLPTARPDWRNSYVNDPIQGGIVLDSGVHAIDLARHLAGPIQRIQDAGGESSDTIGRMVEDHACIWVTHQNDIRTTINLDWAVRQPRHQVIFTTKFGQCWMSELWDGTDKMFERETREFLRCIKNGKAPPNPPEEATETLRWCIEARDMVRDGVRVAT